GVGGWRWWTFDLLWAVAGGLGIGAILGTLVSRFVLYLRREHQEAVGLDEFLTLGLIALSYGAAVQLQTYGFLAVLAAGIAMRRIEMTHSGSRSADEVRALTATDPKDELASDPESAPAYMAQSVLGINERLERIAEVAVVVLI